MSPEVSIILPIRNAAATLGRALESLEEQTFRDWELIAIDDGSTDATAEVLAAWARREPRLRRLSCDGRGIVAALNVGLRNARGGLIARMDADDVAHPERLAEQVRLLRTDELIGLASCLVDFGGDRMAQSGYARHVDWLNTVVTPGDIELNRFIESPLAHPSVMFRAQLVSRFGGYRDGDFPEDYELWLRWLDGGVRMAKVPRLLLTWHDLPDRLSRADPRYAPDAFFRIKAGYLARAALAAAGSRPVWIWGAGRPTRKRASHLEEHGVEIAGYIDIDPRKAGCRLPGGCPVILPEALPRPSQALVLGYVTNPGARELIRSRLTSAGYREGRDFLMAA